MKYIIRRLIGAFIDLIIIYSFYTILYFARISHQEFRMMTTFIFSLLYNMVSYRAIKGSIGNRIMGLRIGNIKSKNTWFCYFARSFMKSIIFVPFSFTLSSLIVAIIFLINTIILQLSPIHRGMSFWDLVSGCTVIADDRT